MRKRHTPGQIIQKPRQADADLAAGKTVAQACQALGVSEQAFHRWRNQYGGMKADEAKRLRELEQENARLKRLVAELSLDKQMLQEVVKGKSWPRRKGATPPARSRRASVCRSGGPAGCWASRAAPSGSGRPTAAPGRGWSSASWNWPGGTPGSGTGASGRCSGGRGGR
jgi:transposase-like protein